MKFIRCAEVCERTGFSRVTIWRLERAGKFPSRRELGPNSVAWLEHEIDKWIRSRTKRGAVAQSAGVAA